MTESLAADFNRLAELKAAAKDAQAAADQAKKELKEFEQELYQRAIDGDPPTLGTRTNLGHFNLKATTYGTITDFEAYEAWVREQDLSDEFLKLSEVSARLNELVRERLETHQDLPPGVSYYERRYISHTSNKEDA